MFGFLKAIAGTSDHLATIAGTRRDLDYVANEMRSEVRILNDRIAALEEQNRFYERSFTMIEKFLRDHSQRIEKLGGWS